MGETVDPKAEAMYGSSPYTAMGGNPISHSDPHGDFYIFPHVNIGSGGVSIGLEVGIGVPGVASASVTVGAGTGGAYASVQGTAFGAYAGYGTQGGGFAGYGLPIGGGYVGVGYSQGGGWGASAGFGGAPGRAQSSIGVGWSQNGGLGVNATVGAQYTGAELKARFGKPGTTATASTDPGSGYGPEWDWNFNGAMDLDEAMWWYKWGGGKEVRWDLNDVDLSGVYVEDMNGIGEDFGVNLQTRPGKHGNVLGNTTFLRTGESTVGAYNQQYDFEMHGWGNPLNWGRNAATLGARALHGNGTPFTITHYKTRAQITNHRPRLGPNDWARP